MESYKQDVSKVINTWLASVSQKATPALGFRGTTSAAVENVLETSVESELLANELAKIHEKINNVDDNETRDVLARLPWQEFQNFAREKHTWQTYLALTGSELSRNMDEKELELLTYWLSREENLEEFRLVLILLKSTSMAD